MEKRIVSLRSRLYRRRFLRQNTRWKALDEIDEFHIRLVTLIFKVQISSQQLQTVDRIRELEFAISEVELEIRLIEIHLIVIRTAGRPAAPAAVAAASAVRMGCQA